MAAFTWLLSAILIFANLVHCREHMHVAKLCEHKDVSLTRIRRAFIESPNWGTQESYNTDLKCSLLVTGDETCHVSTICNNVDLRESLCEEEYLLVYPGANSNSAVKLCGPSRIEDPLLAEMGHHTAKRNALRFDVRTSPKSDFHRVYSGFQCLVTCKEPSGGRGKGQNQISLTGGEELPPSAEPRAKPPGQQLSEKDDDESSLGCTPCDCKQLTLTCQKPQSIFPSPWLEPLKPFVCPTTTTGAPCETSKCPAPPTCPPVIKPTPCPVHNCTCPKIECPTPPPPPTCPTKPPKLGPECDTIYTIVNALNNKKLDSRFNGDRHYNHTGWDTYSPSLERWFIFPQDKGYSLTSTSMPTPHNYRYSLRTQAGKVSMAKLADRSEFKWELIPAPASGNSEYKLIKSVQNGLCLKYIGENQALLMVPENKDEKAQWWKMVREGDLIGCTRNCMIVNQMNGNILSIKSATDLRLTIVPPKQMVGVWNIFQEIWGYRITNSLIKGGDWSLALDVKLQVFVGDSGQNFLFRPVEGPGGSYLIQNAQSREYLRNNYGQLHRVAENLGNYGDAAQIWNVIPV